MLFGIYDARHETISRHPGILVHRIWEEGVHFRRSTTDSAIIGSTIRDIGLGNPFGPNIKAEHIDTKEGTVDNVFDGTGLAGQNSADSWVDVKGSFYRVIANVGTYTATPGSVFANGYETHEQFNLGYGCGNVFQANVSDLGGVGKYAFYITNQGNAETTRTWWVPATSSPTRSSV